MKTHAIVCTMQADIPEVIGALSPESREDLQGFDADPAKWPGMVDRMVLDCEYAYSVVHQGRAVCLFGAVYAGDGVFETWMLYRDEFKSLRGVTGDIRAIFDAEFARASRRIQALRVRVLSRLTLPQSADWLELLGFQRTDRKIVTPTGATAFVFERG